MTISEAASAQLAVLHPATKRKIRAAFDSLRVDPEIGSPLHDEFEGYWRIPVGRWRVVYRATRRMVDIAIVGPRATVYQDLARIMRKER